MKRLCLLLLSVLLFISFIPAAHVNAGTDMDKIKRTFRNSNINAGDYTANLKWIQSNTSYAGVEESGYYRVDSNTDGKILIEHYGMNLEFLFQTWLNKELSKFGGFYSGKDYYYLVFGEDNPDENDNKEVYRIVKYDKSWNRVGAASISNVNCREAVRVPKAAMTESDGILYINTNNTMYKSLDGLNHQVNFQIAVKEDTMEVLCADSVALASHSFNQFVMVDDSGRLLTLDQSDGNPERGAVIWRFDSDNNNGCRLDDTAGLTYVNTLYYNYNDEEHESSREDNETHATLGGFTFSDNNYITSGTSTYQKKDEDAEWPVHNAYITVTPKNDFTTAATRLIWLTDYKEGSNQGYTASTPYIVKLSNERFVVMWNEINYEEPTGKLKYTYIDGNGDKLTGIYTEDGALSDCVPVTAVISGKTQVLWTVNTDTQVLFYFLDSNGTLTCKKASGYPKSMSVFPRRIGKTCQLYCTRIGHISSNEYSDVDSREMFRDKTFMLYDPTFPGGAKTLAYEEDYGIRENGSSSKNKSLTKVWIKPIGFAPYYYGDPLKGYKDKITASPIPQKIKVSISRKGSHPVVKWTYVPGAMGYKLYRKRGNGAWKCIKTYKSVKTHEYKDTKISKNAKVSYRVKAWTKNASGKKIWTTYKEEKIYSDLKMSKKKLTLSLDKTVKLSVKGVKTKKKVKWTSSDTEVAVVSKKGVVTPKNTGDVIITAKAGTQVGKCIVHVTVAAPNKTQKNAVNKIILQQKSLGAVISDDITDETVYKWDDRGNLEYIFWDEAGLKGNISFSSFPELKYLYIRQSEGLTGIDIKKCTKLKEIYITHTGMTSIDTSGNTKLEILTLDNMPVKNVDNITNQSLKYLHLLNLPIDHINVNAKIFSNLEILTVENSDITELDVHDMKKLKDVRGEGNKKLETLNISGCENLTAFNMDGSSLEEIDCSGLKKLNLISFENSTVRKLNLAGCVSVNLLQFNGQKDGYAIEELILTGCSGIEKIDVINNGLKTLNVSDCAKLKYLDVSDNKLEALDVSHNRLLSTLIVRRNNLSSLDITGLSKLYWLRFGQNENLKTLIVKGDYPELELLEGFDCSIEGSIKLGNCPKLKSVSLINNNISGIDLSGCPALADLDLRFNASISKIILNASFNGNADILKYIDAEAVDKVSYY